MRGRGPPHLPATAELMRGHPTEAQTEALGLQVLGRVLFQITHPLSQMMWCALSEAPELLQLSEDQRTLHVQWRLALGEVVRQQEAPNLRSLVAALQEPNLFELEEALTRAPDFLESWRMALPLLHDAVRTASSTREAHLYQEQVGQETLQPPMDEATVMPLSGRTVRRMVGFIHTELDMALQRGEGGLPEEVPRRVVARSNGRPEAWFQVFAAGGWTLVEREGGRFLQRAGDPQATPLLAPRGLAAATQTTEAGRQSPVEAATE